MFFILIVSGLQQTFTLKFSERQRTHLLEKFLSFVKVTLPFSQIV